jgi:hypothetical protein
MFDAIRQDIQDGERRGVKIATFHYHVLIDTDGAQSADPKEFCWAVGMQESFATEFRKMVALSRILRERGIDL